MKINSIPDCYPPLIVLENLPEEYKQKISSHYGIPLEEMTGGGRNSQGRGIPSDVSVAQRSPQKANQGKCRNLGKVHQSMNEIPSQMKLIQNLSGSISDRQQYLERAYEAHCVFHRRFGTRLLSRNRFYADVQHSPWFQEQNF